MEPGRRKPASRYEPDRQRRKKQQPVHNTQSRQLRRARAAARRRRKLMLLLATAAAILLLAALVVFFVKRAGKEPQNDPSSFASLQSSPEEGSSQQPASESGASQSSSVLGGAVPADDDDWRLILANPTHPLPTGFEVETTSIGGGREFDVRAAGALRQMLADGNATGLQLMVCSAYRSTARQTELFEAKKQEYIDRGYSEKEAAQIAGTIVAVPGTSEHATGLAADIVAVNYQNLDDGFEDTPEFAWLSQHAAEYGFILRYPKDKEEITQIIYEPWHYRYVGVETAKEITARGLCLEEYLGKA